MEQQQGLDNAESKAKSFLQAKWFPTTISILALIISIGGHAFTATNSVGYVTLANKIRSLETAQELTQRTDGTQDRAVQILNSELAKHVRAIQILQEDYAQLRKAQTEKKSDSTDVPTGNKSVREEAQRQAETARVEKQPKANGVNERFDSLIRSRMKPHWDQLPTRTGDEKIDDDDMVVLQFQVDRQGTVQDVQVANSSGQMELDNSAVKAALRMNVIPEIAGLNDQAYAQIRVFRLSITPAQMK